MRFLLLSLGFLMWSFLLSAQEDPIKMHNPSFEDMARHSHPPRQWYDCGAPSETPPDVQPGAFDVSKRAADGDTYLGVVVRDNDTWEAVSQRLSKPLEGGKCYEFSLYLCRSELYISQSRITNEDVNYTTPAKLRIWAGSDYCNKAELLAESSLIINTRWLQYNFKFEPNETHKYIVFEAFYKTPTLFPYNGNVLIDHASEIVPVPCDQPIEEIVEEPIAEVEIPEERVNQKPTKPQAETPTQPEVKPTPAPPVADVEAKIIEELDRNKISVGQTIRIDKLYFEADSSRILMDSYTVLDEIFGFLSTNPDVIVELGGHTNSNPPDYYCDKLSNARAYAVAEYLAGKGIEWERLQYRGYGKRSPVATNKTASGRKRNQRVEIKILAFDG